MKSFLVILSLVVFFAAAESCHKPGSGSVTSGGGTGGGATICVVPEHHGYLLDSCMVYVKYGTLDAPSTGIYDDSIKCTLQVPPADTTPMACFRGLTNGIYYFFAQGYHPGYGNVKGATNWTVTVQDSQQVYLQTSTY